MKEKRYGFLLVFVFFILLLSMSASAVSNADLLIKNAERYWRRGVYIQYDDPEKYQQSLYFSPEEAIKSNVQYTNCGAFVSALYMETFGIELPWRTENLEPYMRANENTPYIVDHKNQSEYTSLVKSNKLISHIAGKIQPGDLIVCRFNSSNPKGHVMMVYRLIYDASGNVKDAWLIHSTGKKTAEERYVSAYDHSQIEGSVRISKMSSLLGGYYSKIVNGKSWVYYYGILRPLAISGKWLASDNSTVSYQVTDSTSNRYKENAKTVSKKSIAKCRVTSVTSCIYTGNPVVPSFKVVTPDGKVLKKGKDYLVTYLKGNNIKKGNAFVMAMGIGEYSGSKKVPFKIVAKSVKQVKASISSVTLTKDRKLRIKWKKNKNVTGYQIQAGINSKFKNSTSVIINNNKTTTTIAPIQTNANHYIRMRCYTVSGNNTRVYGPWSAVKKKYVK